MLYFIALAVSLLTAHIGYRFGRKTASDAAYAEGYEDGTADADVPIPYEPTCDWAPKAVGGESGPVTCPGCTDCGAQAAPRRADDAGDVLPAQHDRAEALWGKGPRIVKFTGNPGTAPWRVWQPGDPDPAQTPGRV
jgi:hypothetical protein